MLLNEFTSPQQLDELDLNKLGRGIGRALGGTAQAVGAAAGGIAGIPGAVRRGYQAGKNIVGQGIPSATTATATQPAQQASATAPIAGKSTGAASTYSTITNPETGKLYTKAELRAKYGQTAGTKTAPVTPGVAPAIELANAKQAKQAIDNTMAMLSKLPPQSKRAVIKHTQDALTKLAAKPTPAWTGRGVTKVTKPAKVTAPPPAGAPTAAEREQLEKRIQQAMGKQPVAESLTWSADFDPSETLLRKIQ